MEIVYDDATLEAYVSRATEASPEHPVLIDRFLDDAIEIDVDALFDGEELYLGGVMEHIEEAGIHSGDSACALPPITLGRGDIDADPGLHRGDRARRGGARAAQRPVRAGRRGAVRAGGQPAGVAHGAVRVQGHRGAAGQGGGPDHARRDRRRQLRAEGMLPAAGDGGTLPLDAPIAVKEAVLPFGRFRDAQGRGRGHRPRPGDALHRRGDGHRRGVRHRLRQVAGGRLRGAAGQGPRVRVGGQTRTSGR